MPEYEVHEPGICSICGEEKEPEELSELDGQPACLDCIAQAGVLNVNIPLEQIANAAHSAPQRQIRPRQSIFGRFILTLFTLTILAGGGFYIWRIRHRDDTLRKSATSLKAEGDAFARAGKLEDALTRYEEVTRRLQSKPLDAADLVALYHQTEKAAAAPYHKIILPRLERVEAMLLAGRNEDARAQFRELADYINRHTTQPEISVRERIDRVTDQLRIPRIAKANWRKETPAVAVAPTIKSPIQPPEDLVATSQPILPQPDNSIPKPTPSISEPSPITRPRPALTPVKPIVPVSVPDTASQARAEEQIRSRFADKYVQRDPLSRRALAHLLLITAQEPASDGSTKFVLLRESHDIAVRAGDARIALAAVDEMARSFLVEDVEMRVRTLAETSQNAFGADISESVAETGLVLADRMVKENHYDEAYRCAVIANAAAEQSRQAALIVKTSAKLKELAAFKRN
ncbi:MAG TPA: hypothetical protein VGQ99_06585 [Tepidisphaeraceae bacterium]|jgi:hypothetical protein|nr:hypothetical protein [Tepidisphaeraceae bacterium]